MFVKSSSSSSSSSLSCNLGQLQENEEEKNMTINTVPARHSRMTVTRVEEFIRNPPASFSVDYLGSGYRVRSDPERSLVLIGDVDTRRGRIVFQHSLGRKVKVRDLWEYTRVRKSLLSKKIYLLSACEETSSTNYEKSDRSTRVLKQYVVSIDGNDPFIRWQIQRGLDWTISSVAGESYRVDIDLTEALESWASENLCRNRMKVKHVWRDASFTLKYISDAMFDFPHWFGFSKRKFKLRVS
ncbi:mesenteric estrogen-dependent adipogenesis protein-like [Thalassophryne amazonica]|uniref:mesenteric estrogen-dependent adipogenesis protein-like n=1 Tax=Thalassophryne amazonica TaxID=390379 RepID=UPI00147218C5|nr:mesenteric estrogen-dependent adipogenesis protein-like [Thalassophryne amazonica]